MGWFDICYMDGNIKTIDRVFVRSFHELLLVCVADDKVLNIDWRDILALRKAKADTTYSWTKEITK